MSRVYAIIGGSGFNEFSGLEKKEAVNLDTPYGDCSSGLICGEYDGNTVYFLPRHGIGHSCSPHMVPYRANILKLKSLGVTHIIAANAVGGIAGFAEPGVILFPDQVVDYSYGRDHTFFDGSLRDKKLRIKNVSFDEVQHAEFTEPFDKVFRDEVIECAKKIDRANDCYFGAAVYACTQGPRLESASEIKKLKRDGCDLVGMTLMPECALARELNINYAALSISVNWAAGLEHNIISLEEIKQVLERKIGFIKKICFEVLSK